MKRIIFLALLLSTAAHADQDWRDNQSGKGVFNLHAASYVNAGYFLSDSANAPCPGYAFTNKPCVGMGDDAFGELFWYTDTNAGTPSMALRSDVGLNLLYAGSGKNGIVVWPTIGTDYPELFASAQTGFGALEIDDAVGTHSGMLLIASSGDLMKFFFTGGAGSAAEWSAPHQIIINPTTNLQVPYLGGGGTRCVQVDNSGNMAAAVCASGSGTIVGPLSHDVTTPSSSSGVATVVGLTETSGPTDLPIGAIPNGDALVRSGASIIGAAFQVPGNYITALTHDVTAAGPGSVSANVVGIEDDAVCRGDLLFANESAPSTPSAGDTRVYVDATSKNICAKDDAGNINHGIRTTTCGTHTFAMQVADNGVTGCAQVQFSDLGGSATCTQRPAQLGDSTAPAGSCTTTNVAITETSGPQQLTFGAIPDSNPQSTVLIRPTGTNTIVGIAASLIADSVTKHDYFLNEAVDAALYIGEWASTSNDNFIGTGIVIEYPNDFKAGHIKGTMNLISTTGITSAPIVCALTLNGVAISGGSLSINPSVTANGFYTTGTIATSSASASDTYGLECSTSGALLVGAQYDFSYQEVLTP